MSLGELLANSSEQTFVVSHFDESDFKQAGLRKYAKYRDLGFAEATHGLVHAQVIRLIGPCTDEVRQRHYHNVALQMVYVLTGGITLEIEGRGQITVRAGGSFLIPAKAAHTVLDYFDDCEVLEINMPAGFETVNV